jgi:hypothetical protein
MHGRDMPPSGGEVHFGFGANVAWAAASVVPKGYWPPNLTQGGPGAQSVVATHHPEGMVKYWYARFDSPRLQLQFAYPAAIEGESELAFDNDDSSY